MTVYIEYVLIDNFVIDYILLKSAFALLGKKQGRKRLFLCSFLCAILALVSPLISINPLISGGLKIATLLLVVSLSFKFSSGREYVYFITLFLLLTFLTGGAIIGVYTLFGLNYSSEISIALMIIPVYIIVRVFTKVIKFTKNRKTISDNVYKVRLNLNGKSVDAFGFMDTGNCAFDGDSPLIFCDKKIAKKLLTTLPPPKIKFVEVSSVGGCVKLLSFKLDELVIYYGDKPNKFNNVTLCACENAGLGYSVVLNPNLGENYETIADLKKIS